MDAVSLGENIEARQATAVAAQARALGRWAHENPFTRAHWWVGVRVVAGVCLLLASIMPLMEIVPFSANAGGLVLMLFSLALIAGDGLMALMGSIFTVATVALIAWSLLS